MVLVLLPPERARLTSSVFAAGAVPVLEFPAAEAVLPDGVGVRVRSTENAPGNGPILATEGPAIPGRACWRESTSLVPVPEGYAGLYLRGLGSGGVSGEEDVRGLAKANCLLDWPHPPSEAVPASAGIVLSDVLFGLMDPPAGLKERLGRLKANDIRRVGVWNVIASLAAPVLRKLLAGAEPSALATGVWESGDAFERLWAGGAGLLHAGAVAREYGTLEAAIRAWTTGERAVAAKGKEEDLLLPEPELLEEEQREESGKPLVAIIGMGCRLPMAPSPTVLWQQLLAGFDAITEVPSDRWDWRLFWDANPQAPDRTYAKIGSFVRDFRFNPRRFRVPPSVVRSMDPLQQLTLEAAADALEDAGYGPDRSFDRERTAVILGNSMGGEITHAYTIRVMLPALRKALSAGSDFAALPAGDRARILNAYEETLKQDLPPITEDSMPGELSNVVAGRVANALNLGGPNFTTDAACASSMAGIEMAVKGLQDGEFDLAVSGGADRSMSISTYVKFCKIGALSPDGSRPFDAGANGFVMGEGAGIVVLKRLSDALRDGDKVYAVIRGIGASSDGKGKGITAPNPEGQMRALKRAYESAELDPAEVDLFECHGTSTVVGDKVEVESLTQLIGTRGERGAARIGSIKSNIGHLKSAAGAASILKATLAVHHGVFPPSIHYRNPRADLPLEVVPLQVQTRPENWEAAGPRFAGVSAFGFGGTNFHIVLEQFRPGKTQDRSRVRRSGFFVVPPGPAIPATSSVTAVPVAPPPAAVVPQPFPATSPRTIRHSEPVPVPEGIWALSADTPEELIVRCRALMNGRPSPYEADAPLRLSAAAADDAERDGQLDKAISALQKGKGYDLLRQRGIVLEDEPCDGQLAFLFTGQGSQYLGMGLDLAAAYPIVAQTFAEADEVMGPELGRPLSSYIRRDPSMAEDVQFEALRATEISQPATLTVDVALLRLLQAYGLEPDVVAGHSLGEYGAAVAANMLSFRDALLAVSARGREMAAVKIADFGKMAGIATSVDVVMEVLAEIPGYVIPANKNCPTQTVIAGESEAVEAASEAFRSRGITVFPLPVSHAFHSRIVAPASEPLKRVLERLNLQAPSRRISSNVNSRYYPAGEGAREAAIDLLARQVAAPVEWIDQIERMYADGARIFVECGPKRALSGFVASILRRRPHRALHCNQPKRGGVLSFRDCLASLFALGFPVREFPDANVKLIGERRSTSAKLALRADQRAAKLAAYETRGIRSVEQDILQIVSKQTGYPVEALDLDFDLEADLGIDSVKLAELVSTVREKLRMEEDPDFRMESYRTLRGLVNYTAARIGATRPTSMPERRPAAAGDLPLQFLESIAPAGGVDASAFAQAMAGPLQQFFQATWQALQAQAPAHPPANPAPAVPTPAPLAAPAVRITCSGASVGLPGGDEVFAPDNVQRILRGENRIRKLTSGEVDRFLDKGLVRLEKNPVTGEGTLFPVERADQVIRLAGMKASFDPEAYGIEPEQARSLDITTLLAFAAGLEALKDAGIPLVRRYRTTTTGKQVPVGWMLPTAMQDETGVVFASAFPGYDQLIRKLKQNGDDGDGRFDRRFLFQVLSMGHSQFAQLIGARGPNTAVNAACASTTQAVAIAEDWIRTGRCRRVIVIGADDATGESLLEWIGSGFLAAGAAATDDKVEDAALPFDRRRHGLLLGMGAVGLVLEREEDVAARGMEPIAELLASRVANSAFHGTRLDAQHISATVAEFAGDAIAAAKVSKDTFARRSVFMSHETFTPARGGSAAAEIAALPAAFGPSASEMIIANTKGFTGHAMGAGLEDAVVLKILQYQQVPPIPNFKEPDPDLGNLRLSRGGPVDVDYAIRLSAGFGSQLALLAWKRRASGDRRIVDALAHARWLGSLGKGSVVVEQRQLRFVENVVAAPELKKVETAPKPEATTPTVSQTQPGPHEKQAAATKPASHAAPSSGGLTGPVLPVLLAVIAEKTGYGVEEIDPSYELEADLGIDTVKQAEIFAVVRERYNLPRDDHFKLSDYRTVNSLAGWVERQRQATAPAVQEAPPPPPKENVLELLVSVVAAKTGYEVSEIDPAYELEADLGIDTVKQAEIFAVVRERLALPRDDHFKLSDYRTIEKLAVYLEQARDAVAAGGPSSEATSPADVPSMVPSSAVAAASGVSSPAATPSSTLASSGAASTPTPSSTRASSDGPGASSSAAPSTVPSPSTRAPSDAPAAVPSLSTVSVPSSSPAAVPVDTLALLIEVVSAKTGYEVSEIDPDFELEADLGVDTVKQAEIFSVVRERLKTPRDDKFKLSDYRTVRSLAGYLESQVARSSAAPDLAASLARLESSQALPSVSDDADPPGSAAPDAAPETSPDAPTPEAAASADAVAPLPAIPEAVNASPADSDGIEDSEATMVNLVEAALPPVPAVDTPADSDGAEDSEATLVHSVVSPPQALSGNEASSADSDGPDEPENTLDTGRPPIREELLPGKEVAPSVIPPVTSPKTGMMLVDTPPSEDALRKAVDIPSIPPRWTGEHKTVVPRPAPTTLVPMELPEELPENFRLRRMSRLNRPLRTRIAPLPPVRVLGSGYLAEALRLQIARHPGGIDSERPEVVVDAGLPALEAFGEAKNLAATRPRWICVLEDDGSGSLQSAQKNGARAGLARALGREWESKAQVIYLDPWLTQPEAAILVLAEVANSDGAADVWLSPTTREVGVLKTEPLPRSGPFLEAPVVLLTGGTRGITAEVAREIARRGPCTLLLVGRTAPLGAPLDEHSERQRIKGQLSQKNSRVTPKMIEEVLAPLRSAEEVRRNVESLKELGATVEVYAVDLGAERSVQGLLRDILDKYGRLDLVIHGAGIEESRKLLDKSDADFRRVYAAKADGGMWLAEAIPEGTFFVSMGSVAGFFGNAGQVDYAAANNAMARVCAARPWSLHVAWTAWGGTGMAMRGSMDALLTRRGVELLPAKPGASLLVDMIAAGMTGEVLAAGKLGDFRMPSWHPVLDDVGMEGDTLVGFRTMTAQKDPWMEDHSIDGVPVLPGVMGLEMMVATAMMGSPEGSYFGAEEVKFLAPLKLYREDPVEIEVRATPEGEGVWNCSLHSRRTARTGKVLRTEHFQAKVYLEEMPLLPDLPAGFLPEEEISGMEIYRRFFHGHRFQVLQNVEALAVQGMVASAQVGHRAIAEGLLSDPLVLEAAFQAAGLHRMVMSGVMALPAEIDAVSHLKDVDDKTDLTLTLYQRGESYDIDVDDAAGPVLQVRGFRLIDRGPLPPDQGFVPPEGGWASVAMASSSESGSLSPDDQAAFGSRGTERRRADRLAGQLAGVRALAHLRISGRLRRDSRGAPVVEGAGISLSHQEGEALAVALPAARVGVDLETVEARDPSFLREWFHPEEWPLLGSERALAEGWAIKEAVLKALGTGLALSPREVRIEALHQPRVRLYGEAQARHQLLGGAPFRIRRGAWRQKVVALATFVA